MATRTDERDFSDLAIPPGELLAEELEARGMSQRELADRTGRPEQKISEIINGKKAITYDTALELEKVLGIAAAFWVNLESSYQLTKARLREINELERQEDWLDFFPVKEMQKRGLIGSTRDNQELLWQLLKFFGVASFPALKQRQEGILGYRVESRASISDGELYAWLREGELKAQEIETQEYDEERFVAALHKIRELTVEKEWTKTATQMKELCASAGVAFVVVRHYPKSAASAVARWLSADKAMIQLSTRRRWVDVFWFNFFHEADHVLKRQRKRVFVNKINDDPDAEREADEFAAEILVQNSDYEPFAATNPRSHAAVTQFATKVGIHAEVIVGRLQHDKILPPSHLNGLRRRFVWKEEDPS